MLLGEIGRQTKRRYLGPRMRKNHETALSTALSLSDPDPALADILSEFSTLRLRESAGGSTPQPDSLSDETMLSEASYDGEQGVLDITILQPGLNRSGKRFYTNAALKESFHLFKGLKMYADHDTRSGERERPERSIRDFVGVIGETSLSDNGSIRGKAFLVESWLKEKISTLQDKGLLHTLGVSHNSFGKVTKSTHEGKAVNLVEAITRPLSVDFVTEPGAGGSINFMESDPPTEDDPNTDSEGGFVMDEEEVKAMKESIEGLTAQIEELKGVKSESEKLTLENTDLKAKIEESEKATFAAQLETSLKESELPEEAQARIKTAFGDSTDAESLKERITAEKEYIDALRESFEAPPTRVSGLGPDGKPIKATAEAGLQESFSKLGIPEDLAKDMAAVR